MKRLVTGLATAGLVLSLVVPSAFAQVDAQDVAEARERMRAVTAELEDRVAAYDAAVVREVELRERLDELLVELTDRERRLVLARAAAKDRVADMYMGAGTQDGASFLGAQEFSAVPARLAYLDTVAETDREIVNRLEAARQGYLRQQALLEETVAEQEALSGEMESLVTEIYTSLEDANAEYQAVKEAFEAQEAERRRREEEERRRRERELFLATSTTTTSTTTTTLPPPTTTTAPPATTTTAGGTSTTAPPDTTTTTAGETTTTTGPPDSTTTTAPPDTTTTTAGQTTTTTAPTTTTTQPPAPSSRVCPVDGAVTFRDSWGEPRSGGRTHTGTDMMAPTGTPLVAIESGRIWSPNWHYAGGYGLYIRGDSGDTWYYAHLNAYASGIADGVRVSAGQLVGYVGTSGNASVPHLHIGWLVGGVTYTNPYPVLAGVC
ncbi:MAG: peptidoglycan DD-metalloendopeptidase family protein [Acidimicrobiia bacterium]|nr:peptidoglycan DD-metalloendopeptidase family protein [Acidimicrobiia bacterium]